jgi:P-type Ca2+ transporter type 2C
VRVREDDDVPAPGDEVTGGLSDAEVELRRRRYGPNAVPTKPRAGPLRRMAAQLRDPTIVLLLGAALLASALRDFRDVAVILVVVVVNTVIGVGQEVRAERALEALRALAEPAARVWRNGVLTDVAAVELVPGDRIVVEAGDVVPADGALAEAAGVEVNEAALTGESQPVAKGTRPDEDRQVRAGTVVTRGRGTALVTATGPHSAIGAIASLLGREPTRATPLQGRLRGLGRILAVAAVVLSMLVLGEGLLRGRPLSEMVLTAVSLAVAAVPESLPAVVVLALALGARRMSRRSAIMRRLSAVETLGSVTVFLTDKTGTLTQGRMSVERVCAGQAEYVCGDGGQLTPVPPAGPGDDAAIRRVLRDAVLCNDAELCPPDEQHDDWWSRGEATEAALVTAAAAAGLAVSAERAGLPRIAECPFDSVRKRMTTVHRRADGAGHLVICKGAPEVLLDTPGLVRSCPPALLERIERLTGDGFRVLLVAEGTTAQADALAAERDLDVVGLVALADPPRAEAYRVVQDIGEAGIEIAMVTGDHPATARSIAARLGITGEVFARTRPEQKFDLVERLQQQGHVVAMTGDGVNDAPALERADIGIAMGRSGTEVAKQAADLILTDDRLGTVVVAIGEGRRIYANIRTFLRYALAGGLAEVVVMLLGPFVGLAVPLLPGQILWINLLTHGLPGVAFGAEPGDPDAMRRPPRSPQESVLGGGLWHQVVTAAALVAAVALAAGMLSPGSAGERQTAVFLALGLAQLGVAVALRRWSGRDGAWGFLDLAVASSILLQLAAVYLAPLARLLDTEPLSPGHTLVLAGGAALPGLVIVATRRCEKGLFPPPAGPPGVARWAARRQSHGRADRSAGHAVTPWRRRGRQRWRVR